MKSGIVAVLGLIATAVASAGGPAMAASSTTCLCRTEDAAAFRERTHRHHRWACDYKFGYVKKEDDDDAETAPSRPSTQTCNSEEIIQYKIWACVQRGCTYQYTKRQDTKNPAVEVIELLDGERRP